MQLVCTAQVHHAVPAHDHHTSTAERHLDIKCQTKDRSMAACAGLEACLQVLTESQSGACRHSSVAGTCQLLQPAPRGCSCTGISCSSSLACVQSHAVCRHPATPLEPVVVLACVCQGCCGKAACTIAAPAIHLFNRCALEGRPPACFVPLTGPAKAAMCPA